MGTDFPDDGDDSVDIFGDVPEDELALSDALLYIEDIEGVVETHRFDTDHISLRTQADAHDQLLPPEALRFLQGQGFHLVAVHREFDTMALLDEFPRETIHRESAGDDPGRELISSINQYIQHELEYAFEFKRGDALVNHASEVEDDPYKQWQPRDE